MKFKKNHFRLQNQAIFTFLTLTKNIITGSLLVLKTKNEHSTKRTKSKSPRGHSVGCYLTQLERLIQNIIIILHLYTINIRKNKKLKINKQRKHHFTSFLSFFRILAEETGRNCFFRTEKTVEKTAVFSALEETGEPCCQLISGNVL